MSRRYMLLSLRRKNASSPRRTPGPSALLVGASLGTAVELGAGSRATGHAGLARVHGTGSRIDAHPCAVGDEFMVRRSLDPVSPAIHGLHGMSVP